MSAQMQASPVPGMYAGPAAYSNAQRDPLSGAANPASLTAVKRKTFALYGGRDFGLKQLQSIQFAVAVKTGFFYTGITAIYHGYAEYNESGIMIHVARKAGDQLDVGISLAVRSVHQSGYRNLMLPGGTAGFRIHPLKGLTIGMCVEDPFSKVLPSLYRWGIGYDVSEHFYAGAEIFKQGSMPVFFRMAFSYQVHPVLFRAGFNGSINSFFISAGLRMKTTVIIVSASLHPQLGFSQAFSIQNGVNDPH
jgi:hypothetical protein